MNFNMSERVAKRDATKSRVQKEVFKKYTISKFRIYTKGRNECIEFEIPSNQANWTAMSKCGDLRLDYHRDVKKFK